MRMARRKVSMVGATIIASLLLAACSADPVSPTTSTAPPTAAEIELVKHERLWAQRAPERYTLTIFNESKNPQDETDIGLNPECGEQSLTKSTVELGEVTLAADVYKTCLVDASNGLYPLSVEQLFAEVAAHPKADSVEVEYDEEFGYPLSIHISYPDRFTTIRVQSLDLDMGVTEVAQERMADIAVEKGRWKTSGINSYTATITVESNSSEGEPIQVAVSNGVLTSRLSQNKIAPSIDESYITVSGILDRIEGAVFSDGLTVTYNDDGVPLVATFDPEADSIDDELTIKITNFKQTP